MSEVHEPGLFVVTSDGLGQLLLARGVAASLELAVLGVGVLVILRIARKIGLDPDPRFRAWILLAVGAKALATLAGLGAWTSITLEAGASTGGFEEVHIEASREPVPVAAPETGSSPVTFGTSRETTYSIEERRGPAIDPRLLLLPWALAAVVVGSIALRRSLVVRRLIRAGTPLPPDLEGQAHRLLLDNGVRGHVALVVTDEVSGPAVTGWIHRTLLLPRSWVTSGWTRSLRWALRHEATHLARKDTLGCALWTGLGIVLPLHPILGALRRAWARSIESAVDEHLASTPERALAYAECLEAAVRALVHRESGVPMPALGLVGSSTARRIERILEAPHRRGGARARNWLGRFALASAGLVLASLGVDAKGALEHSHSIREVPRTGVPTPGVHPLEGAHDGRGRSR